MKRRQFLQSVAAVPFLGLADAKAINKNFKFLGEYFEIDLEMINTGQYPNDGTGDTAREAALKINRNFAKLEKLINGD